MSTFLFLDLAIVPDVEYNININIEVFIMIGYITASEAAQKWNISHRRVITLCRENRIKNADMLGKMWIIPANAEKPKDARATRNEEIVVAKPFIKWAGGKGQLLDTIRTYYPEGLGTRINKYCEPMVGAGAVMFDILNNFDLDEVLINDSNVELINVYDVIRDNVSELIEILKQFENEHLKRNNDRKKEYYYSQRMSYNSIKNNTNGNNVLRAALFIYLNKTCFNGLYRVNRNGEYNVPMGSYKNPTICDIENLILVSDKLQNVRILSGDYKQIEDFIDENTFVYFDPPYRPLSKTSEFTSYNEVEFNDNNQIELAEFIKHLSSKGAKVLASNSDPKNTNTEDNFFDDLYKPLNINRVTAKRSINSKGKNRGNVSELLISNY